MLDIKFIRDHPDTVKSGLHKRNEKIDIEVLLRLDSDRLEIQRRTEDLQAEMNKLNKQIGLRKRNREPIDDILSQTKQMKEDIAVGKEDLSKLESEINEILIRIPNLPHRSTPEGKDENDNPELKKWGEPRDFDFEIKDHEQLGTELGILDFERSAKLAGSRFVVLWGPGAGLERALISFMLDYQIQKNGYTEVYPPFLVNEDTVFGTGQLPKFEEDLYKTQLDNMYLISTAEIPVTNLHAREILDGAQLPLKYCAFTTCFRREAGSYGKDTRGIIRVHQFNKVELVKFTKPENSYEELENLTEDAEDILQALNLPYRIVSLCTGDLGFSAAKTYDLEVWLPAQNRYREISSCSNFEDFQAHRANIRFRRDSGSKPEFPHTLNGSGLAIGRTMVAILENYQNPDGSITVPEVLVPYMNGLKIIK